MAANYTGTQLYNQMQGLGNDAEKFLFYRANMGQGSGGNDLQSQWLNQGFGGDLGKFNNWINTNELSTKGSFDPTSGTFNYFTGGSANPVTSKLANWGQADFGGPAGTHNAATSGFREDQTGTPFQTGVAQNGAWLDPQTQQQLSGGGGAGGLLGGAGSPSTLGALAKGGSSGNPGMGSFTGSPTDYFDEAGYKFRLGQGLDQVQNSAAARGSLQSGATLKGLEDYRQGLASQEYGAAFDRFTNARDFARGTYQDDRNFGEGQYQDRRNFNYGASRDDRDFNWQRDVYNQGFGYNAARDDRNFNYGTLRDLAQLGLSATGQSGNLASQLVGQLGGYGMAEAGAGAQGTVGQSNNINNAISQFLQWMQSQQELGALGRP